MKNRFDAVFFDFDYTLADSSEGVVECMSYALDRMGFPVVSEDVIRRTIGLSLKETFRILTGNGDPISVAEFIDIYIGKADEVVLDKTYMFDGVRYILERLKSSGITIGIVSTKFRYRIKDVLRRDGLLDYFDVIVGGEDVPEHKPNPEGLNLAVSRLGISKERVLFVGDSVTDAETARNAGVSFVAVLTGVTPKIDFAEFTPLAIVDDLSELAGVI